jgi:hypothetical protein
VDHVYDHDCDDAEIPGFLPAAGPPGQGGQPGLTARHARLLSFIRVPAYGADAGEAVG